MATETDIVNQALMMIGNAPINSINDSSASGTSAKVLYYAARDGLLREIPWNFARKQVALNQLNNVPLALDIIPLETSQGRIIFTGAFALPLDFLRMYRFSPKGAHWRLIRRGDSTGDGRLAVITDAIPAPVAGPLFAAQPPNANGNASLPGGVTFAPSLVQLGCEYIARITDATQFDPLFVEVLSAKLASQMAQGITGSAQISQQMATLYKDRLADAAAVNGMENWPDALYDTAITDARYGYSGSYFDGM